MKGKQRIVMYVLLVFMIAFAIGSTIYKNNRVVVSTTNEVSSVEKMTELP